MGLDMSRLTCPFKSFSAWYKSFLLAYRNHHVEITIFYLCLSCRTGVAGSLTQASACPAQPSGKASKGQAASSNSTSQDTQASIKGEPASACATTSSPPVAPSSASAPTGPALPPAPVNEQDQDDAETKRVKRSLFKNGETASPGNASPSSGPSSGGLDLLLYAAFEHNSSTGAEAAKPNTEAHGKAPQGKAPVHRCITQAAKPAEGLKCDEQVVFATDDHAKDDVAPAKLPRQPSDQVSIENEWIFTHLGRGVRFM